MEKKWEKEFNLSNIDQDNWKQSGQKDSFALWALKNKKINQDQYIKWVTHSHNIPFLIDKWFYEITISQQLWNKVQYREQWNEGFVPVYEWEDILFAGCVEPPEKIQSKNTVPVLASPKSLSFLWNNIKKLSQSNSQVAPSVPSHNNMDTSISNISNISNANTNFFSKTVSLLNPIINKTLVTSLNKIPESKTYDLIFKISEKHFKGVIIFSFTNNEFKPLKWNHSMNGPATPVKTDTPSIFRMIAKSKNPYHGFIVKNEQHTNFFKSWGWKKLPQHITLIPVFDNSKNIIGAYMGIADKVIHQKYLYEVEKWITHLPKMLQNTAKSFKTSA